MIKLRNLFGFKHERGASAARSRSTRLPAWHLMVHFPLALVASVSCYWPYGRGAGSAQELRRSKVFLVLLWAVTASPIVTGYRGGQNVYRYGVGVALQQGSAQLRRQE
jgi:hypothetical protein